MRAFLKKDPSRIGDIAYVYIAPSGQKRLAVFFVHEGMYSHTIDAAVEEFEIIADENKEIKLP